MNKYYLLMTAAAGAFCIANALTTYATPSHDDTMSTVAYHCNERALEKLYAYMDKSDTRLLIPVEDQFAVLGQKYHECLREEGYQVSERQEITRDGYTVLMQ